MQIPIDVKAVFDEATNIDAARQTPLSVSIYMDETAPGDVQALVRQAFASASPHARVSTLYFPSFPVVVAAEVDVAVIVAGVNEEIGKYAAEMRDAGVPVMIVTSLPELVSALAEKTGYPLPKADILGPFIQVRKNALPAKTGMDAEPHVLDNELSESLSKRMGEWIIETCKEKRLAFALAFSFVRRPLSLESVNATSVQNAGIGLVVFIPGADMPIMTLNQAKMLLQIAAAYGQPMNVERVKELAAVVGGAFAFRSVARQAVAFVPALGWAIKAGIGYTGTFAMGHAAIEYFEGGGSISGLAGVVGKARDKVMEATDVVSQQPSVKAAMKTIGNQTKNAAGVAARKVVPVASSVVSSAVGAASDAGVVPDSAARTANSFGDLLTQRFKKN